MSEVYQPGSRANPRPRPRRPAVTRFFDDAKRGGAALALLSMLAAAPAFGQATTPRPSDPTTQPVVAPVERATPPPAAPVATPAAPVPTPPGARLITGIRNKLSAADLSSAESLAEVYREQQSDDGSYLLALSWLAR